MKLPVACPADVAFPRPLKLNECWANRENVFGAVLPCRRDNDEHSSGLCRRHQDEVLPR